MAMTLFVLLPAYNEEDSIPALVPKIFAALTPIGTPFPCVLKAMAGSILCTSVAA